MTATKDCCAVTVITRDRLPWAKAFAEMLSEHSQIHLLICIIGPTTVENVPNLTYLTERDLKIPDFYRFAFQYTAFEFCCAIKPWLIAYALDQGFSRVLYFDCDIGIYAPLDPISDALERDDVLLTRHQTAFAPDDGCIPSRGQLRRAGLFNAGFVGVAGTSRGREFIGWWQSHCETNAYVDISGGVFVDQSWLDFAPFDCDGIQTNCPDGWNTAYWNLFEQPIRRSAKGELLARDSPLVFFHYSGFDWKNSSELSRYQNRHQLIKMPVLQQLAIDYAKRLAIHSRKTLVKNSYHYARLNDGTLINPLWREAVRCRHPLVAEIQNPFDAKSNPRLKKCLRQAMMDVLDNRHDWQQQAIREIGKRLQRIPALGYVYRLARLGVEQFR